jgi:hypothetical protein
MFLFDIVPPNFRKEKGYPWRVVYLCDHDDQSRSELHQYLTNLSRSNPDELDNLMNLFMACCEHGPEGLPAKTRHHLDQNNQLFELIKKRHRIAWFYDEGKMVVCTHAFFKRTQKTPKEEQQKAAKMKTAYFTAKKDGTLSER